MAGSYRRILLSSVLRDMRLDVGEGNEFIVGDPAAMTTALGLPLTAICTAFLIAPR